MELFQETMDYISLFICLFSIVVLCWGVVRCVIDFFRGEFRPKNVRDGIGSIIRGKNALGFYILLSLEILIAADTIDSIVKPTWEDIGRLAVIVVIRTVISHFLNQELKESNEQLEQAARVSAQIKAADGKEK